MKSFTYILILLSSYVLISCGTTGASVENATDAKWISLFNGENLDGWKVGENASSFSVVDGTIKVEGPRSHLYYVGDVENHDFKNFEFKTQVMTKPGANSGIYFHTKYQPGGWPKHGFEVQVNNSQSDWRRTGSLYDIVDIREHYAKDNEWYTEYIKVVDNRVIIKVNDIVVVDYTQPENPVREEGDRQHRVVKSGTFAFQAHDPGSVIFYKDIMVRPLE